MKIKDTDVIGVEAVEEHEDGSATYQFHFDDDVKTSLAEYGLKLVLYCAAAQMDMQKVFDYIQSNMGLTEYKFDECVSCGGLASTDFCEFCLNEE
jgi:hypothetical protein